MISATLRSLSPVVIIAQQFKIILVLFMHEKPLNLIMWIIMCFTVGRRPSEESETVGHKDKSCILNSDNSFLVVASVQSEH